MQRISVLLFTAIVFLTSCQPLKVIPVKGLYPSTPMNFKSDQSFEKTWDKLIDVFAQKGLSIHIIDKSSGIITCDASRLTYTTEDKYGNVGNTLAYIVVPTIIIMQRRYPVASASYGAYASNAELYSNAVFGSWNVRIKANGNGSIINVNISNINYAKALTLKSPSISTTLYDYKSTGIFEKELADLIK